MENAQTKEPHAVRGLSVEYHWFRIYRSMAEVKDTESESHQKGSVFIEFNTEL